MRLGWMLWGLFGVAICVTSHQQDFKRTVVNYYRSASLAWIESEPIYELTSAHGFLYLPSAAALQVPFALLPRWAHEILFRAISIVFLAWAVRRLSQCVGRPIGCDPFLGMSLLIIPTAIGSAMAGQMNIILAATMALAAADAAEKRYNRAAIWLGLGFALKPQMAVFLLLIAAVVPGMRLRSVYALAGALLAPFLLQSPSFVLEQYQLCVVKLRLSGSINEGGIRPKDLFGLLGWLGVDVVPDRSQWLIRLIMAPVTLLAAWLTARRTDPTHAAVTTLAWAAVYLMLFNPRTEGGSTVIIATPLAAFAAWAATPRFRVLPVSLLVLIAVGWAASYPISQLILQVAEHFKGPGQAGVFRFWLSPLLSVVFLGYLVHDALTRAPCRDDNGFVSRTWPKRAA